MIYRYVMHTGYRAPRHGSEVGRDGPLGQVANIARARQQRGLGRARPTAHHYHLGLRHLLDLIGYFPKTCKA